jgi:DNA-binding CsgD family transcriptional regulator/PAS domain-containing protein
MLTLKSQQRLNTLIQQVYHTVIEPAEWEPLLQNLADYFRAHLAANVEHIVNDHIAVSHHSLGYSDADAVAFRDYYGEKSIMYQDYKTFNTVDVVIERRSPNFSKVLTSETYNDFHLKHNGANGLIFVKSADTANVSYAVLRRDKRQGEYSDQEMQIAQLLLPHLVQASQMAHQFALKKQLTHTFEAAFDKLNMPIFLLHHDLTVVYINHAAEKLLSEQGLFTIKQQKLTGLNTTSQSQLKKIIGNVFKPNTMSNHHGLSRARIAPLPPCKNLFFEFTAIPLVQDVNSAPSETQLILLTSTTPADNQTLQTHLISDFYQLTAKEAQVVQALCQGLTTAEIAAEHEISQNAVRFHTKNIYQKLHINRQSELVKLILSGPIGQLWLQE